MFTWVGLDAVESFALDKVANSSYKLLLTSQPFSVTCNLQSLAKRKGTQHFRFNWF